MNASLGRLARFSTLLITLLCCATAWAAPRYDPETGHWYDVISGARNWEQAKTDAESRSFYGLQGHLVTITTAGEQSFVTSVVGAPGRAIIGAYQTDKTAEPAGNWAWVTGETWSYTNWNGGEPNNSGGAEDCAHLWPVASRAWNDIPCSFTESSYVIEYEGDGVEGQANFVVTKEFSDGSTDEVEVMLSCNGGLPLEQSFTIAGGDPDGVGFVVAEIPGGGVDCTVTEVSGPQGYEPVYNGGAGCDWDEVTSGVFGCHITNEALPAEFSVTKDWVVANNTVGDGPLSADVTIYCNNPIVGGSWNGNEYELSDELVGDGAVLTATVDTTSRSAQCRADEEIRRSGVESDVSDCGTRSIDAGGASSCTIVNVLFFEGIPTLNGFGLALMALLMLGVGFVGLRRFA